MTDAPKHPSHLDPANELASDSSPIDPRDFRNALGTYATGVTIITAIAADGKPYGLTCNSFASVSLNPPLVLWSLGMFSQGLSIFQNASHFAVNVLGESQQALATKFAKSSEDKFAGVRPNVLASSRSGCRRTIAARSSLPRRLNFSRRRDLGEARAIWRAGSASPSRCCIVTFQARTT